MPRQPKPFFHRGWWVTDVGGQRTKLAEGKPNRKEAVQALRELLANSAYAPQGKTTPQLAVWELCEKFLDWVEIHRAEKTFADYKDWLGRWVKEHGKRRAREIRSLDLEGWKTDLKQRGLSNCTVNHAIVAVKTCWSWGLKHDLLPRNPLQKVPKLHAEGRERVFTGDEFSTFLRNGDPLFRQVLLFFRLTGIRPGEFCRLKWEEVDFDNHVLVIRQHKSRRTAKVKKPRIIHLPPAAEKLLRWRLDHYGRGERVFLNSDGQPWQYNALRCRIRRLRERAGIEPDENGEQIVLYTTRHTFGSRAAAAGVSDRRLAELMGHTDPKMTQKYIHLANPDLRKAALEATATIFPRSADS